MFKQCSNEKLRGLFVLRKNAFRLKTCKHFVLRIIHLTDPLDNAINEKCSRIKKVFTDIMDEYSASYYIISGHAPQPMAGSGRIWYRRLKVITLPRELVVRE